MARQRFVHPALWSDPDFGVITDSERILFVGLFSNADDEGRILASPAYLRALVWPYQERLTSARVRKLRDSLVGRFKSLQYYEIDGIEYIQFAKWGEYQKPKYPTASKLPAPPEHVQQQIPLPPSLPEASGNASSLDWVGKGRDGLGRDGSSSRGKPSRKKDDLWDALEDELGPVETESERGRRNKALKELRDIGATVDLVHQRCDAYRRHFPEAALTATALVHQWSHVNGPTPHGTKLGPRELMELANRKEPLQ